VEEARMKAEKLAEQENELARIVEEKGRHKKEAAGAADRHRIAVMMAKDNKKKLERKQHAQAKAETGTVAAKRAKELEQRLSEGKQDAIMQLQDGLCQIKIKM
jgi:hypothetical protein